MTDSHTDKRKKRRRTKELQVGNDKYWRERAEANYNIPP